MRVAVTGSTGLIGTALVAALRADGDEVVRLVRRAPHGPGEVRWDPDSYVDVDGLHGVDAVVHLAGVGVGRRPPTKKYNRAIWNSRVNGTTTLALALTTMDPAPSVFVSASGSGYYADTGDQKADETWPGASGFMSDLVVAWEAAAEPARATGIRVVHPRTGIVLSRQGGALQKLIPIFKAGLGGKLGAGRQYWSFISIQDEVRAIRHLIATPELSGPVNLTAPEPVTNAEFTKALATALHRPAVFRAPAFALRLAMRDFANELLRSHRLVPARLLESGFRFDHPTVDEAIQAALSAERAWAP